MDLTPWHLRFGYRQGAFPMGEDGGEVRWYAPIRRALLPIEGIHVSRSLAKRIRAGGFELRFDTAFEDVMRACRRPADNWINEPIIRCFTMAHREGWAHSCEVWREGSLVGGVYGLALGTCFSAESMFHRETDMSKIALWAMVNRCRDVGFEIFDAQLMNPHLQSLGAYEMDQDDYLDLLNVALEKPSPALTKGTR